MTRIDELFHRYESWRGYTLPLQVVAWVSLTSHGVGLLFGIYATTRIDEFFHRYESWRGLVFGLVS